MMNNSRHYRPAQIPDVALLHAADAAAYPCVMQSLAGDGSADARYDIVFAHPRRVWRINDRHTLANFCDAVGQYAGRQVVDNDIPFSGGWCFALQYEAARLFEDAVADIPYDSTTAAIHALECANAVIWDRHERRLTCVSDSDAGCEQLWRDVQQCCFATPAAEAPLVRTVEEEVPTRFTSAVAEIIALIRAGEVYQVNVSRRWRALVDGDATRRPFACYRALRQHNPAPYAGMMRIDEDTTVISSSPERLLSLRNRQIRTEPIAGTRPRGKTADEDEQYRRQLLDNAKERAEHVMLVDLERNDLGRICRPRSVRVAELSRIARFAHVQHLVSDVVGSLRDEVDVVAIFHALFPGGTITGCPKIRSMAVIAACEQLPRGWYTGSLGYIGYDGAIDCNILIRSMTLRGNELTFRAGAGIVADSDSAAELAETRAKARGMLRALRADD